MYVEFRIQIQIYCALTNNEIYCEKGYMSAKNLLFLL